VSDGSRLLATVTVNQKTAPNSFVADGSSWQKLGAFKLCSGTLVVQLTNRANGQVVADAVRIERVDGGDDPTPPAPATVTIDKHDKHDKSDDHDSDKHGKDGSRPAPHHHTPAPSAQHKGGSSTKPAPKKVDAGLLHKIAVDVALHHAKVKSHK